MEQQYGAAVQSSCAEQLCRAAVQSSCAEQLCGEEMGSILQGQLNRIGGCSIRKSIKYTWVPWARGQHRSWGTEPAPL